MTKHSLEETAQALVATGKGILAADESVSTIGKRFGAVGIPSTEETRRAYREMLFTTPGLSEFVSGVIMYDETIRQVGSGGDRLGDLLSRAGIAPGIKVDSGAKPLAGCPGETVTEGLDGLRDRLQEYRALGARFAKWRAVIRVDDDLPSETCLEANAHALGRYAALCQEQALVPIVEPEVLMDGTHSLARAEAVTGQVLDRVFRALSTQRVSLEGMLLKPNMVVPGTDCPVQASVAEVATATRRVLRRHVPAAVPGIVFLSGGQDERHATAHLSAMNAAPGPRPWRVSFSYGRALQDSALAAWGGRPAGVPGGQQALYHRARCNGAATRGTYSESLENDAREAARPAARSRKEPDTGTQALWSAGRPQVSEEQHMLEHVLDEEHSILFVRPQGPLEREDFVALANTVDPYIERTGGLAGLIVEATAFPGWETLGAMAAHFRFVRDHHRHIKKVGVVTDSALGQVAEHLASHFVSAEIRHFSTKEREAARAWIMNRP